MDTLTLAHICPKLTRLKIVRQHEINRLIAKTKYKKIDSLGYVNMLSKFQLPSLYDLGEVMF